MSVLELSDESRIIRDAARAWSRGDIPLDDYRMIRRATLEGICGIESRDGEGEDTAANDDTEVVAPGTIAVASGARKGAPLLIGGAVLLIVIGALAFVLI